MKSVDRFTQRVAMFVLIISLAACSTGSGGEAAAPAAGVALASANVGRETSPDAPRADLQALAAGNRAFALDLYQALRSQADFKDGNIFFSPYSISSALAMVYGGARGNTEQQMAEVLHFTLPQAQLHPAFNALDLRLADHKKDDFNLQVANSAWAQKDYHFLPAYLDLIARNYGAGIRLVDYTTETAREQARQDINQWVEDQTEERIKDLIPAEVLNQDTRLVLANAIYFKAEWETPFAPDTQNAPFHLLDGSTVEAPLMSRRAGASYAEGEDYQAVGLIYQGDRVQMIVVLPAAGKFNDVEGKMDAALFEQIVAGMVELGDMKVYLPSYSFEFGLGLKDTLSAMGMPDAFTPGPVSDFSGMIAPDELFLREAIHKAFVAVDELGTEAAAATGAVMEWESLPPTVRADRPFLFFIYDRETGTILFAGRVLNPLGA